MLTHLPKSEPDRAKDAGQHYWKQLEPGIEVALVAVAEPDVVIRAVGRRYLLSLRQVPVPRAIVERAQRPLGRGRQPPDDRVLDGSYPFAPHVVQKLAKPETRPEHAALGWAPRRNSMMNLDPYQSNASGLRVGCTQATMNS